MRIPLPQFKIGHVVEALCWTGKGDHQRADTALEKADAYLRPFLERPISVDGSTQHG